MGITVTGLTQLLARITQYSELFEDLTPALQVAVDEGVQNAVSIVPVDTGYLQSTIGGEVISAEEAEIYALAEYAAAVEYGTIHMDAQPYLEPSLEIAGKALEDEILRLIGSL
jgi:ABC-type thiamine transport system substrate-binding protein